MSIIFTSILTTKGIITKHSVELILGCWVGRGFELLESRIKSKIDELIDSIKFQLPFINFTNAWVITIFKILWIPFFLLEHICPLSFLLSGLIVLDIESRVSARFEIG